ncbi:hypothetical protein TNCV_5072141 [Trichonephila clavipes]|nr:hypothetical protein TNCV_5072141 [Trichonephila clavipes]
MEAVPVLEVEIYKIVCEKLAPKVSLSPSCLPMGVGGIKAEPENSIITIIYLVKLTNQQQSIPEVKCQMSSTEKAMITKQLCGTNLFNSS